MVRERVGTAGSPMFSVLVKKESEEEIQHLTYDIYEFTIVKPMISAETVNKYVEYGISMFDKKKLKYRYATNLPT